LKGVGPKCANLALGIAGGQAAISVDVHVHRVVNRWGFIQAKTPEQTMLQLESKRAEGKLDRHQPAADAVWQAHLYRAAAALLYLPGA
jgi:endonuclease III